MTVDMTVVNNLINAMTEEERWKRLADYMTRDESLMPKPIGVEVRLRDTPERSGRYVVLIIMDDGTEKEVKFRDRHSRLVYIYTLLHPKGYRSAFLKNNGLRDLQQLYSKLYFASAEVLQKYADKKFKQYFYQSVAQSRVAIRQTVGNAPDFEIACPKKHMGRTIIPAAANTDNIIIDNYCCPIKIGID